MDFYLNHRDTFQGVKNIAIRFTAILIFIFVLFTIPQDIYAQACDRWTDTSGQNWKTLCQARFDNTGRIDGRSCPGATACYPVCKIGENCCGQDIFNNKLTFCSVSADGTRQTVPWGGCNDGERCFEGSDLGTQEAGWAVDGEGLKFCYGGFPTELSVRQSQLVFSCTSNCGGLASVFSADQVYETPDNAAVGQSSDGKYWTCINPQWDQGVFDAIRYQIGSASAACGAAGLAATLQAPLFWAAATIGSGATQHADDLVSALPLTRSNTGNVTIAGVDSCLNAVNNYSPTINTDVRLGGTTVSTRELSIRLNANTDQLETVGSVTGAPSPGTPVSGANPAGFVLPECSTSYTTPGGVTSTMDGIQTALGCIPSDLGALFTILFAVSLGIAGGIAFLLIIFGGLKILMSAGDPEAMNEGRELVTSAITGLILIIFSVFILRVVGVDILAIPGFR